MLCQKLDHNQVQCQACSHYCRISPGQTGLCGVRENQQGELKLLVYGRPCAVNIDPIEKKPLYHFLPGTKILSLGTFGCNFHCDFCQNWQMSQISRKDFSDHGHGWKSFLNQIDYLSPDEVVQIAKENNLPSVAYTYNEPAIWSEYAIDIARLAKKEGIKNVYVTNGYLSPECLDFVAPYLDAVNIDLKSFDEEFYLKTCGAKLQPVLNSIKKLHAAGVWIEITTLVIPGANDLEKEFKNIAEFIASVDKNIPWHLSAFHPDYKIQDRGRTELKTLERAKKIGHQAGLKYVYLGNI